MALSKTDREFYEKKLDLGTFGYIFGVTVLGGTIMWPGLIFIQDWSAGQAGQWTFDVVVKLAVMGFLVGSIVAVAMYLIFKFLLEMGWLPSRR